MKVPSFYLQTPDESLWHFDAEFQAVQWGQSAGSMAGKTIAVTPELSLVLGQLFADLDGLPDLTAVLFLIAASRADSDPRWLSSLALQTKPLMGAASGSDFRAPWQAAVGIGDPSLGSDDGSAKEQRGRLLRLFRDLGEVRSAGLKELGKVFVALFEEPLSRATLVQANHAQSVISWLDTPPVERRSPLDVDALLETQSITIAMQDAATESFHACWSLLNDLASWPIDVQQLMMKLRTGVEELPDPAEVDLADERYAGLISKLQSDSEFGQVASAARQVASVLSLPLRPSDPANLPIGGVSDITNRGDPERLLMTELAADSSLLLARIATGQALYMRRESPPDEGIRQRDILIENSVRTWGQTRIRALAVALGLASSEQSRKRSEICLSTLAGAEVIEEEFTSREGLTKHLEHLSPTADCRDALKQWCENQSEEDQDETETPVLVIPATTWADEGFRESLRLLSREWLIATIDHLGDVALLRYDKMGAEQLRRIRVETLRLGESKTPSAASLSTDFPAFVRQLKCPLRMGINSSPTWCVGAGTAGLWMRTPDERLLWFDSEGKGGRTVLDRLSFRSVKAFQAKGDLLQLVLEIGGQLRYVSIEAHQGVLSRSVIPMSTSAECFFDLDALFVRHDGRLFLIDQRTGETLDWCLLDGASLGGVPFQIGADGKDGWELKIFRESGSQLGAHSYRVKASVDAAFALRDDSDVPLLISRNFTEIQRVDGNGKTIRIMPRYDEAYYPDKMVAVSSNRRKAVFEASSLHSPFSRAKLCLNLQTGEVIRSNLAGAGISNLVRMDEPSVRFFRQWETLTRFVGAGVDHHGLVLFRRQRRTPTRLMAQSPRGFMTNPDSTASEDLAKRFKDTEYVSLDSNRAVAKSVRCHSGWGLRKIQFGDAILWLDSRGLLHLAMRDRPNQLSIVLCSGHVCRGGGWFSDQGVFGATFHHDAPDWIDAHDDVWRWYEQWLEEARRGM